MSEERNEREYREDAERDSRRNQRDNRDDREYRRRQDDYDDREYRRDRRTDYSERRTSSRDRRRGESKGIEITSLILQFAVIGVVITLLVMFILFTRQPREESAIYQNFNTNFFVSYRYYVSTTGEVGFGDTTVSMTDPITEDNLTTSISGIRNYVVGIVAQDRGVDASCVNATLINIDPIS